MLKDYSAPIAKVYGDCTELLLQNIARHFNISAMGNTPSFEWETVKLAELDQLRRENIAIIARMVGDASGMTEIALEQAMLDALAKNEPILLKAVRDGFASGRVTGLSDIMRNTLRFYSAQATAQANLVNTVMLTSSQNAARKVISTAMHSQQYLRDVAQGALNTTTGEVITGVTSRQAAVRDAIRQMAKEGITGFVDKGGHLWSPEAYVSMDIRSTAGNVAREAVWQQCEEMELDLVIVPVNATARPKCAPFQGKVISRSGKRGYTKDRYGNRIAYIPIGDTTYGEPDGLFGINCHHNPPDPFIPGMSKQHDEPLPGVEEHYAVSQKQRYLERQVKDAKRKAACYEAAGDTEAFEKAAKAVKEKATRLKSFCSNENQPFYSDRIQVLGYNRSVSGKVTAANRILTKQRAAKAEIKQLVGKSHTVHIPPTAINPHALVYDAVHVNVERLRNITAAEAVSFVKDAKVSVRVWGPYERYFSESGAAYVDLEQGLIRTAFRIADYTESNLEILEVVKKHGI